jgi:uncharacterized membrane protein YphA (DoxX/SURF4 family)
MALSRNQLRFNNTGYIYKMAKITCYSWQELLHFWDRYWFPETTAVRLATCRIIAVASQLFLFFPLLSDQITLLKRSTGFIEPQLLVVAISAIVPSHLFFTPGTFTLIQWVMIAAGVTALIGLCTRTSAFVFAACIWVFNAHASSYGEEHHGEAILAIFLLLLAFAPSGARFSLDAIIRRWRARKNLAEDTSRFTTAMWPLRLIQVLLALSYFSTGMAKLIYSGLEWMNGYTLQSIIFSDAVSFGIPLGIWLAQQYGLCVLLSIATILFEVFFFVILFVPRLSPYFLVAGALFHTTIFMTIAAPFFQHIILYSVFIDFGRWKLLAGKASRVFEERKGVNALSGTTT